MTNIKGFDSTLLEKVREIHPNEKFTLPYYINEVYPKYTFLVIDCPKPQNIPIAVFVVPQGSENEYHYATDEGNKDLCQAISAERVLLVFIDPHYTVENLESIIKELGLISKELIPKGMKSNDAPILTAEEGVGNRKLLFEKKSDYNGNVLVEETSNDDGSSIRRMKFEGFRTVVQSEAVVVNGKLNVEKSILQSPYLDAIRIGMCFFWHSKVDLPFRVVIIGAGGCTLTLGIKTLLPESRIVSVDVDPVVVEAASKYFFATHEETTAVITMNGIEYLTNLAHKSEMSMLQNAVHAIIIDVDNKTTSDKELIGPPLPFVQQNCIVNMVKSLFTANMNSITPPMIIYNIVARDSQLRKSTILDLAKYFKQVYVWQGGDDINTVVFAFPHQIQQYNIKEDAPENKEFKEFLSHLQQVR
ncbi:hypothetical protein EHI8A_095630 [Entamoeba histolytica HM-1:IMSS-B]|uniref:Uncharacterized protein n=8 Tax=Entamoeba TaxID=5758 RepID=C4LV22_ENTH1|nr:hypothetical protein ENU1_077940 [Entamoeba nuttalli P19]XP_653166.1 hypothetical protein, conserved [Entamoeba histolytica HM-1:IMSS]EMD47914.1 Hypothetical protein EHI5A_058510 [Entamoeba histolytica KU27]EMH77184.1 hypothetical protein EHI8A_095630 [Entamoeba histolytica HM-1:IMSS-B]EMS11541.1 hypothetical protein KM1_104990 [Entamoeba histolytica HM-3:IMSS]ENY60839.1 hypothetical protein EHI7A_100400 [Entamoeba histolytica HM-1:IMSS-A]GAT92496.1 hypothetical protein conserved [Entamoeb|eukprot:XP_008856823.1 hypothetical protein ENU1_077940 [Entamoeba nuttalli P19]